MKYNTIKRTQTSQVVVSDEHNLKNLLRLIYIAAFFNTIRWYGT